MMLSAPGSYFKTSRHYLSGTARRVLPALHKGLFQYAWTSKDWRLVLEHEPQIIIGERANWGDPQAFGISVPDLRQHVYVIGKTGSGKTTLLRNMLVQHISQGHGTGLIDPRGDLAEKGCKGVVKGSGVNNGLYPVAIEND